MDLVISLSMNVDFFYFFLIRDFFFPEEGKRNYFKIVSFWESSSNSSAAIKNSIILVGISFIYPGNLALKLPQVTCS